MNRILLTLALLVSLTAGALAQKADLTGRVWKITEDMMTGVGKHESLPSGTTLEFLPDGTWTSSSSFRGATQGTWVRSNEGQLRMTFGQDPKSRPVKLLVLTTSELRFRVSYLKGTFTYGWKAG